MPPKKMKRAITLEVKSKILQLKDEGLSTSQIGRQLNMPRTTIQTILKGKEKLLTALRQSVSLNSTILFKRNNLISEMEKLLSAWIQDQTYRQVPLSLAVIQNKALSIFNTLQNSQAENSNDEQIKTFSASRGWFMRFKKRYLLHNIREQEEAASVDNLPTQSFPDILREIIESGGYSPKQIFNVVETGLFWKKMPTRTYISQEEKSMPGFKAAKDRLTLLLGSNAEGDLKLKPLLIYRSETPRALKNIAKNTLPVIWKANQKALVTAEVFENWFTHHFIPVVQQYCLKNNLTYKALLLLDNAPEHPLHIADIDTNIKVVFLPPNITSLLQPMDQGVISSFKAYYLRRTFTQAVKAVKEDGKELREFWKSYNILQGVKNIAASWNEVKPSYLQGVWKNLCPHFFEVECLSTIEELDLDNIISDIVQLANALPNIEVSTEDIEDLLDSQAEEPTDNDLMEMTAHENTAEMQLQSVATAETGFTLKNLSEAFSSLQQAMNIFEKNDPNSERSAYVNSQINAACQYYRDLYEAKKKEAKQTKIDSFFKSKV